MAIDYPDDPVEQAVPSIESKTSVTDIPSEPETDGLEHYFNRPPRIQPALPVNEIEVPGPPEIPEDDGEGPGWARIIPMVMTMLPTLMYAVAMLSFNPGRGSSAIAIVLVRFVGPVVTLVVTLFFGRRILNYAEDLRKERAERKARDIRTNYEKRLRQIEMVLEREYTNQRSILHRLNPSLDELKARLPYSKGRDFIFPDPRLWERRATDPDFLNIRIGTASLPSFIRVKYPDPLDYSLPPRQRERHLYEAIRIGKRYEMLHDVPMTIDLKERGAISVVGDEDKRLSLIRAMLLHLVVHHAPQDVMVYIIAPHDRETGRQRWTWTRWLPHCNADRNGSKGVGDLIARDENSSLELLERLLKTLNRRREYADEGEPEEGSNQHIVLIIDDYTAAISQHPAIASVLSQPQTLKVSVIFNNETVQDIPSQCTAMIRLDLIPPVSLWYAEIGAEGKRIPAAGWDIQDDKPMGEPPLTLDQIEERSRYRNQDTPNKITSVIRPGDPAWYDVTGEDMPAPTVDQSPQDLALQVAEQHLANIRLRVPGSSRDMPQYVGFLDMYGVTRIEDLNLSNRWFDSDRKDVRKGKFPLPVPIGMFERSKQMKFHFLEGFDGPHGLVAGTTGSGKSEYLQTLVGALAVEHHPHFLAFFLVDYKGGSSFVTFKRLPHTVGVVSDLAPGEAQRALTALKSEIQHRKSVFATTSLEVDRKIKDIIEYHKLYVRYMHPNTERESGDDDVIIPVKMVPIPHLVIIIDEFAELKQELPHFMPEMSRIARVGRSLGIHLLLATQRPAGSVSEEVRANSQSAVCLRVRSVADSRDMIGVSDAMFLPNDIPGRGFIKSGSNQPVMFQSGYMGDKYDPSREARYDIQHGDSKFSIFWSSDVNSDHPDQEYEFEVSSANIVSNVELKSSANDEEQNVELVRKGGTVVERLVEYIVEYTNELPDYQPLPQLWQEPLPEDLALDHTLARREFERLDEIISRSQTGRGEPVEESLDNLLALRTALIEQEPDTEEDGTKSGVDETVVARRFSWKWNSELWDNNPVGMRLLIGLLDDPANRRQELCEINFNEPLERGHLVVYGAPSTGKTTLLRTIISGMAQYHSPWEVHFHIIDFGVNNALRPMQGFPHVGNYITPADEPRMRRLLNWLQIIYRERRAQDIVDIYAHNRNAVAEGKYDQVIPILFIVIDNIREFLDVFGEGLPPQAEILQNIAQDGVNIGMVLVMSAGNAYSEIPSQIVRSIQYRMAFRMNEDDQMQMVVGGRPPYLSVEAPAGRSMWRGSPPLEVQVAQTGQGTTSAIMSALVKMGQDLESAAMEHQAYALEDKRPYDIGDLSSEFNVYDAENGKPRLHRLLRRRKTEQSRGIDTFSIPLGQSYGNLQLFTADLHDVAGNIFVIGRRKTGKTTILKNLVVQTNWLYSPEEVTVYLLAPSGRSELSEVAHMPTVYQNKLLHTMKDIQSVQEHIKHIYEERAESEGEFDRRILVLIDDAHEFFNNETELFRSKLNKAMTKEEEKIPQTVAHLGTFFDDNWVQKGPELGIHFGTSYLFQAIRGANPISRNASAFLFQLKQQAVTCVTGYKNAPLFVENYKVFEKARIDFDVPGRGFAYLEGDEADVIQFLNVTPDNQMIENVETV
ncbi:MAG: FtsK/SpoIIIE domain-containing protein [Aggregatilineales bacterium]